jgi:hypothetical protein
MKVNVTCGPSSEPMDEVRRITISPQVNLAFNSATVWLALEFTLPMQRPIDPKIARHL